MSKIIFEQIEKELLLSLINKRLLELQTESKTQKEFFKIINSINSSISILTPLERAYIEGCINQYVFSLHRKMLSLNDVDLLTNNQYNKDDYNSLDIAISTFNKLKPENKYATFASRFTKINLLKNPYKLYYSETLTGEVYKVGIFVNEDSGIYLELSSGADIKNFVIGRLREDSFLYYASPNEIIEKVKRDKERLMTFKNRSTFLNLVANNH